MTTYILTVNTDALGLGIISGGRVVVERRRTSAAQQYPGFDVLYAITAYTNASGVATLGLKPDDSSVYHEARIYDTSGVVVYRTIFSMLPENIALLEVTGAILGENSIQFKDEGVSLGTPVATNNIDFTGNAVTASFADGTITVNITKPTTASDISAEPAGAAATAQAAAVQRANHTGTQLANTISDFSASASSAAPVQSVFGRTGAVSAQNGDYTAAQVGADAAGSAAAAQAAAVQRANHTGTQLASTISDFNATASAAAPVQSVNGNTGAVTVLEGDSREVRKTQAYWCEDFISYYTRTLAAPVTPTGFGSTTAEDEQQWCIGGTQDAIGVVTLIPTNSTVYVTFSASSHALTSGAGGLVLTGKTIDATWSFCQKKATATDEGFSVCAGFGVAATGSWSGTHPCIGFRTYDDAGVHTWEFITSTGGISTISTITWATSGCAQNTRITCRAVITTASVLFYINGTLHATHTTNIPTTQIPDQIWHAYANLGFTDTSYGVSIDYMDKLTTLTTPRAL